MVSETLKKQIDRFLLAFGFSLMFGIMILGQEFRQSMGEAVGVIMDPVLSLVGQENFHLILLVMAIITALYASLIQKYTIDWELMRNTQERMKVFQKEFREAQLSQNTYMLKKLEDQRKEMMEDQMKMSKQQFKPMAYISIISLPLFMWAYYFISGHGNATMVFPFWGEQLLTTPVFGPFQHWIYWYFISSLGVSQLIRKGLNIGGV
ncbi:TPA: DUF106 domain-containing protein [Methanosarcina acetivorans]|uniref:Integral membrane protein n=5 Tax=Methanosarcina TaxID=2207 RepID=Q8TRR7_METAC|nr:MULTISPECIES: DUF106 domain-containing protein [Methanosarcina]AAM04527.1 integral membrane protein [Methanosarcina acetivorans C2A]AKB29498.1 hypothetical protein MSSIT_2779 [Methanosarcina siciliae T4/M]AKB33436.1 hypothetical protein MSSIH_2746 [Methanosarcina siciliae HI350]AKB37688.1 hypothetical protein MSSAC_3098 [Methanosarcina siciliae C2J]HIH93234.1 DUF106 domain-containing protein [Methanosarcina acetivorans]